MISIRVKHRPSTIPNKEGVIYYQLIHNRVSKLINTSYRLYTNEWDKENSIINIAKAGYHRRAYLHNIENQILRDINNLQRIATQGGDIASVIKDYSRLGKENLLFCFAERIAGELTSQGRTKSSISYKTALRSFSTFRNGNDIALSEIKPPIIKQYEQYLRAKQVCNNSVSFYMRILRAIYNRAVEEGFCEQCFPFKGVYVGIDKTIKRAVEEDVISRLKAADLSDRRRIEFARDMFMFSFYTRGMAFVDIAHLTHANIKDDYIVYQRHKTGQELIIKIEPCLRHIIAKYSDAESKYLLPILTGENPNYESALRLQNIRLKKLSELLGLTPHLTSYVARHSWATLAKRKGVSTQIISECMGHSNEKTTLIYLSSLDRSVIDQANAKLLAEI
ncbi:Integrase [Mucinivorans hirudinis]|uniref:Integrase n=1 Tax=Mucinivorans hirudinis TaxID=1433126 RepID=A0A060R5Q3_9BACT|nr:Integrase [Mucinivorans hirudinis]